MKTYLISKLMLLYYMLKYANKSKVTSVIEGCRTVFDGVTDLGQALPVVFFFCIRMGSKSIHAEILMLSNMFTISICRRNSSVVLQFKEHLISSALFFFALPC